MPDIFEIYRQCSVHYQTEGERHCRKGWVNTACPFCVGKPGLHLGFNLSKHYYHCYRCGWHGTVDTLVALCHISERHARELYYALRAAAGERTEYFERVSSAPLVRIHSYKRPSDTTPLRHENYLIQRGFDPDRIASEWHVGSTGPAAYLDHIDYRNRLFIPILWNDVEVSFQTRAIGDSDVKYKACPPHREAVHHKAILYGRQECWTKTGIAVEGVTDCWRLGLQAFALFGIDYKIAQVTEIVKHFDRVAIVFDGENTARKRAHRLKAQLCWGGIDADVIRLDNGQDPGSLSEDDARHLVKDIQRWQ